MSPQQLAVILLITTGAFAFWYLVILLLGVFTQ